MIREYAPRVKPFLPAGAAETRYARILRGFIGRYGDRSVVIARAPGRVNLMGRHIDHRGGGVNVIAMGFDTVMVAASRSTASPNAHARTASWPRLRPATTRS